MNGGTFISYRREDAAGFAGRLCDSLERHLPDEPIFRDVDGLSPGQDFVAAIDARLRQCRVCLAVIGRDWLNARDAGGRRRLDQLDDFVRLELMAALARSDVLVIPVLVEGASMPPAEALPPDIRALARRQAVSLRDDTWDADVTRLVRSLQPAMAPPAPAAHTVPRSIGVNWKVGAAALALVALFLLARTLRPDEQTTPDPRAEPSAGAVTPSGAGSPGHDVAIPRISQVGSRGLIYTLVSVRIEPGDASATLRLRVALENGGDGAVNFWDESFRLLVDGDPIAPNSHLNTLVAGRATGEGDVTFALPAGTSRGLLRISMQDTKGDVALDFSAQGARDAGSASRSGRAIVTTISSEARPLVTTSSLSASLSEVATRRFANALRVDTAVRLVNTGPAAIASTALTLRLVVGDEVMAPTAYPVVVMEAGTTQRMAVQFEVPPDTTRAILRAMAGDASADVPLTLR